MASVNPTVEAGEAHASAVASVQLTRLWAPQSKSLTLIPSTSPPNPLLHNRACIHTCTLKHTYSNTLTRSCCNTHTPTCTLKHTHSQAQTLKHTHKKKHISVSHTHTDLVRVSHILSTPAFTCVRASLSPGGRRGACYGAI